MSFLILNGVKAASSVEIAGTVGMLITTAIFIVVMAISFNWGVLQQICLLTILFLI